MAYVKEATIQHGDDRVESLSHKLTQSWAWNSSWNTITWILPFDTQTFVLPHSADHSSSCVPLNGPALTVTFLFPLLNGPFVHWSLLQVSRDRMIWAFLQNIGKRLVPLNRHSCLSGTEKGCEAEPPHRANFFWSKRCIRRNSQRWPRKGTN